MSDQEPPWVTMARERVEDHARAIAEAEREWAEHEERPYVPVYLQLDESHGGGGTLTFHSLVDTGDLVDVRMTNDRTVVEFTATRLDLIRLGHQLIKIGQRA